MTGGCPSSSSLASSARRSAAASSDALISRFLRSIQALKASGSSATTFAIMSAWLRPHSSAHWPLKVPGCGTLNQVKFRCPGRASALPPSAGIHQECATSWALMVSVTVVFVGT